MKNPRKTRKSRRNISPTEMGMLLGILIGGGLASIMFIATKEVFYFGLLGVGLALGLGLGAAFDGARPSADESQDRSADQGRPGL